jgi:hypothetical protein
VITFGLRAVASVPPHVGLPCVGPTFSPSHTPETSGRQPDSGEAQMGKP